MTTTPNVLFLDRDEPVNRPLTRFRSLFSLRTGVFTTLERAKLQYPDARFIFSHPDKEYESAIAEIEGLTSAREIFGEATPADTAFVKTYDSANLKATDFLDRIAEIITADINLIKKNNRYQGFKQLRRFSLNGPALDLHLHESADILPGVVFDTSTGPIFVERNVRITPNTFLEGPLYIGPDSQVDSARLTGGTVLGRNCRVGGEVENSIFNDFSNKHHEGFVGHSVLGSWVNLGALTTTSDLKNNYGEIRLTLPATLAPPGPGENEVTTFETGRIKFGSILGDCVKTAIGTMLNTGTVIDAGSNVFGGIPPKYLPPLSWGIAGHRYKKDRFLADSEKIFARRKQILPERMQELVARL